MVEEVAHPKKALIVEDLRIHAELMMLALESVGFQCTIAETLAEAISLKKEMFDVIFLDLNLFDSRGTETARAMRRHYVNELIIVVSGFMHENDVGRLLELGMDNCIIKPIVPSTIAERIEESKAISQGRLSAYFVRARIASYLQFNLFGGSDTNTKQSSAS